ncbi:MAG: 2,3-bisphosphoglycerate-independent phosphoglycerate mutase [Holosporales bacterium]|jgi:2,3-bisphosphoglycerate-independent phosphoglycerate mutase|nr:2,3-bisphosphoglycerate-independent phosphoglycerate mutase [Holosporales bacterium]
MNVALCILDGWGVRPQDSNLVSYKGDATVVAHYLHKLMAQNPSLLLNASGSSVGLPKGFIGNSEAGHSTIGLGRIIKQDLCLINEAIEDGSLEKSPVLQDLIKYLKKNKGFCHVAGLISDVGIHSHIDHQIKIVEYMAKEVPVFVHCILDWGEAHKGNALHFLDFFSKKIPQNAKIVSLCGRFYAMDRDLRWERTEAAHNLIANQDGYIATSQYKTFWETKFAETLNDEFTEPTIVGGYYETTRNDGFIFTNFRADRAQQLIQAICDPLFCYFKKKKFPRFAKAVSIMEYDEKFNSFCTPILKKKNFNNSLCEIISNNNMKQLRVAETEKQLHITHFLGEKKERFPGEDRIIFESPKVKTYEKAPEMRACEITDTVIDSMSNKKHNFIVFNYANADMLGHTGNIEAAQQSLSCVDVCLQKIVQCAEDNSYTLFIVADHGNAEQMLEENGDINTAHTANKVPFVVINSEKKLEVDGDFGLANVAATVLEALRISIPEEITERSLFKNEV